MPSSEALSGCSILRRKLMQQRIVHGVTVIMHRAAPEQEKEFILLQFLGRLELGDGRQAGIGQLLADEFDLA